MNILVIEDHPGIAMLVKRGLELEGHAAECASDGAEGERKIRSRRRFYDLVILDLALPKKSGLDLLRAIRSSDIRIPVLVLSALSSAEDRTRAYDAGADAYMTKPFRFADLLLRIAALGGKNPAR